MHFVCVSSGACTLAQQPSQSFFTRSARDSRLTDIRWDVKLLVDLGYMCAPERQPLPVGSDVAASGTMAPPVDVHICRTRAAATALSWDALPARFHSLTAALCAACLAKVPYCTRASRVSSLSLEFSLKSPIIHFIFELVEKAETNNVGQVVLI